MQETQKGGVLPMAGRTLRPVRPGPAPQLRRTPSGGGPTVGSGSCARMLRPARPGPARAAPVTTI